MFQITFSEIAPLDARLHRPCQCGGEMRLVGIEPDPETDADIFTYECPRCRSVQVTSPSALH